MGASVLIIEDSTSIRVAISAALTDAGHSVLARGDGNRLEHDIVEFRPDAVLLDVMLPGSDGFTLLEVVRRRSDAGILMVTARDAVGDRLHGLTEGADDYVIKPFEMAELVARVNAVLRRRGRAGSTMHIDDLIIDPDAAVVLRAGSRSHSPRPSSGCSASSPNDGVGYSPRPRFSRPYGVTSTTTRTSSRST